MCKVIIIVLLVNYCVCARHKPEEKTDLKVTFSHLTASPSNNNSPIVLHSAVVEYKPRPIQRPLLFLPPRNPDDTTQEPLVINPDPTEAPNKGFVDWLLGLVGIDNQQGQETSTGETSCQACSCGLTYKNIRIVGGVETQVNQYPWMAYLRYNNRFYCGASLISNRYVLTAAHCVSGFPRERLSIVFLDHDRSHSFDTQVFTRKVRKVLRHNGYGANGNYNNDIALLQLDVPITMSGLLKPVCLPPTGKSFIGTRGIVTGWGATQEHGSVSNVLREVVVPIMSNIDCRKTPYGYRITDNMLCAGHKRGMKDSCQGDSGGPLHVVNGTKHMIVGIVSWGEGCAQRDYPGVYTRVNRYISWIKSNTKDACYCS